MQDKIKRAKKIESDKKKNRKPYSGKRDEKNKNRRGNTSRIVAGK